MSASKLINLIDLLIPKENVEKAKHQDLLRAASDVMRSGVFNELEGLHEMTPQETQKQMKLKDTDTYPKGAYSYDHITERKIRRYVFILMTEPQRHIYVKLMLDDIDLGLDYYRVASVYVEDKHSSDHFDVLIPENVDILRSYFN